MKILDKQQLDLIFKTILQEYGIENVNLEEFVFLSNKEGKIFIAYKDLKKIIDKIKFNNCGLYVMKVEKNKVRFSIEGSQIFGPLAKRKIVDFNLKDIFFISGEMKKLFINVEDGFYILKNKKDFAGSIFIKNKEIKDYIPKERKIYVDGTDMKEGNI